MQHLEVRGAVRPLKWSLGVKWLSTVTTPYLLGGTARKYGKLTYVVGPGVA